MSKASDWLWCGAASVGGAAIGYYLAASVKDEKDEVSSEAAAVINGDPDRDSEASNTVKKTVVDELAGVLAMLREREPVVLDDIRTEHVWIAPHIPRETWRALGNLVTARERSPPQDGSVPGERWISLRLDGSNFSKVVRIMRRKGVLDVEHGFSQRFADCMVACVRGLMDKFHCQLGYTQSDEMVVFMAPTSVVRDERQPHFRSGRVAKLTSMAAGLVSAQFNLELAKLCGAGRPDLLEELAAVCPHFDCRLGHWESWTEAKALLLWRGYDCSLNGVSDAVYQTQGSGKQIQGKGKLEKIRWLHAHGKLPLPRHQAYGTILVRVKRCRDGLNAKTGESVVVVRSTIEQLDFPVLELARREVNPTDPFFPADDRLPGDNQPQGQP